MKERKRAYEHKPLVNEEPFRNVSNEAELKNIRARLQEQARKQHRQAEVKIKLRRSQPKEKKSQESTARFTQFPPTVEILVGQYASVHGKGTVERRVQQVRNTIDEHDMHELERVTSDKMVRCVRNETKDPSPPTRPPRKTRPRPPIVVSPFQPSSSGSLYEATDSQEQGQENEPYGEPEVSSTGQENVPNTREEEEDETLEVVEVSHKSTSSEPLTSLKRKSSSTPRTILKST